MVQSWQVACSRCGFANSGSQTKCGKCGRPLKTAPGLLQAGVSAASRTTSDEQKGPSVALAQPGGLLARVIGIIIDNLILLAIAVPLAFLFASQAQNRTSIHQDTTQSLSTESWILTLAVSLIALFYYVGSWNILSGSPGMLVLNLRVVDSTGKSPGFMRGILRYLALNFILSSVVWGLLIYTHTGNETQRALAPILAPITGLLLLLSVAQVGITKTKRGIHDLFAGTFVIQYLDPAKVLARSQALAAKDPMSTPVAPGAAGIPAAAPAAPPLPPPPPVAPEPTDAPVAGLYSPPPSDGPQAGRYSPPPPQLPAPPPAAPPVPLAPPPPPPLPTPATPGPGSADPAGFRPMPWEPVPLPPMPDEAPGEGSS